MKIYTKIILLLLSIFCSSITISAQLESQIIGSWDLVISKDGKQLPSWLEITKSGYNTLVGRFVYEMGSARPISHVMVKNGKFSFSIPPQWEKGDRNMDFEGQLSDGRIHGSMTFVDGKKYDWKGSRAPKLENIENPIWGAPRPIFNGRDLQGWEASGENQWVVEDGILKSKTSGSNLITREKFKDFKIHVEFRYPKGGNSGVYLRGRYEVQIADNKGDDPSPIKFGGIYGFLTPNEMVAKEPGEWQAFDITLIGRRVSIVANGKPIITDQIIPGITGGAIDSNEIYPGPFMLQGDHEPIEYRNIVVTTLMKE